MGSVLDHSAFHVLPWRNGNDPLNITHIGRTIGLFIATALAIIVALFSFQVIYNIYFHPLKSYPGPKLWAATRFAWFYHKMKGDLYEKTLELHNTYGPTVRLAPDELSYITDTAWKTICGYGKKDMKKDDLFGIQPSPSIPALSLISAPGADHGRQRKTVAHAFSEKALREQESWLQQYANKLVDRLESERAKGPVNIVKYYNYVTFDVIGELAFGESFSCLDTNGYASYVSTIFKGIKSMAFAAITTFYGVKFLRTWLTPKGIANIRLQNLVYSDEKVYKRIAREDFDRKDFFSYILKHNEKNTGLTTDELRANAVVFIGAGSETTATALSGAAWYLLNDATVYRKFVDEIRSAFTSFDDITLKKLDQLPYLMCVIEETLRIYPPIPDSLPRFVPEGGEIIDDKFVPGGTRVAVANYAASRSERNSHRANEFIPERWAKDVKVEGSTSPFARDNHAAWQPFSAGPRACIGRNLAYAEMKLFLAKVFFKYDFELQADSADWLKDQRSWLLREKDPLNVKLIPVA